MMPNDISPQKPDFPYWIEKPPFYLVPVCHYRVEFAESVRFAFQHIQPEAIAIELPESLAQAFNDAVQRLPELSVILHQAASGKPPLYLLVEPADPLVEAARLAQEKNIPLALIDLDLDEYGQFYDAIPDPYALMKIGHQAYFQQYRDFNQTQPKEDLDVQREQGMALNLKRFAQKTGAKRILVVTGMAHLTGILDSIHLPPVIPFGRKKKHHVQIFNVHPDSAKEVLYQYGFLSAVYEHVRLTLPADIDLTRFTVRKQGKLVTLKDLDDFFKPTSTEEDALAAAIQWAARRIFTNLNDPVQKQVDNINRQHSDWVIDRQKVALNLFQLAAMHYKQDTGEEVEPWQKKLFIKFSRNYALLQGNLLPDFFHLLIAARACVEDNFGYAFWRLGTYYPWQQEVSDKPTIRISGEDLYLGMRKIRIQRFIPRKRQRWNLIPLRKRPQEKIPGEWLTSYKGDMICSYPPEDIEIENWSGFLKKKASRTLSIEKKRTEPFTTSLLDGIDIRETIRNYLQQKIYVQEFGKVGGDVGAVVVIFDEDTDQDKYPFLMTWLGESYQEGDMALYSTHPLNHIVGPGISRCEYGGFMISYPPYRLFDIWSDETFHFTRSKSERLLAAALDYSLEKYVVYMAAHPPRPFYNSLAGQLKRTIVYLPLSSIAPPKMKKLRVFHVLSGHDKRASARDYIW
ncbi:hypothetical protein ACFL27_03210 [candidate division CSSED10-310 bacterium]|uniref:Haem-binding uptake Tiki superfamily ChaN domain-containing protein n=1 Tax=candidate division CSSED10-310 bacterium TaxID=2855610 RepID=A0ABV6YSM6_UNCC1